MLRSERMVRLHSVTKEYVTKGGPYRVLDSVCFTVASEDKWGILGRNGSGKSTLVRVMAGATLPTSGSIERAMTVSWPLAFGGAFQGSLTGYDNLRFICRVYGVEFREAVERVEDFSELGRYLKEPVKTYSAGMRARLAFGLSLAVDFDCLLIDEIVSVGDSRFHEKCRRELFELRSRRALVIVSHDEWYIRQHCTKVAVIVKGKLHKFDEPDAVFELYRRSN